jgi:30S ribosomal protein S31
MGKGDKKTRRGKINSGSYGKTRPKKASQSFATAEKSVTEEKPKAKKAKKTEE